MSGLRGIAAHARAGVLAATLLLAPGVGQATGADAAPPGPAAATQPATVAEWQAQLDRWVQRGVDDTDAALRALIALQPPDADAARQRLLALGLVQAAAGRRAEAEAVEQQLRARDSAEPGATADAALLRAVLADHADDTAAVLAATDAALEAYGRACAAPGACDHRARWLALTLASRHETRRGLAAKAEEHLQQALALARDAADGWRHAWTLALQSDLAAAHGDLSQAQRLFAQALRLAQAEGSPRLLSRMRINETLLAGRRGDADGARQAAQQGLALARQAGAVRLQVVHLNNLADLEAKAGRPAAALAAVQQALPLARQIGHQRFERTLLHNAALAHLSLGRLAEARQTLDSLRQHHRDSGARGEEAVLLREFADGLARAGDLRGALDLYHQERELAAAITAANREAALAELRRRFDQESQQRRIGELERENRLRGTQLDNQATLQKVWLASALALAAALGLVAMLYRRVRHLNRHLASNHAALRAQSQRDPLTGLANRRGLHETAQALGVTAQFSGALLLVDIDHFKHINDGHGHAAGDAVLVEVARRLADVVRENDLVVRWGGEEFLIFMPGVQGAQAQALAERVLKAVGSRPVPLATQVDTRGVASLRVTVSVGHAAFPLPPGRLPLTLERAINLVDMALYSAKGQGRNRAIGITAVRAGDDAELHAVEADFEQAWQDGRLTLQRLPGPVQPAPAPAPTQPAALV